MGSILGCAGRRIPSYFRAFPHSQFRMKRNRSLPHAAPSSRGASIMTALIPNAANVTIERALADYALDDRIVRALSLAVHDVVARLVAVREAERGTTSASEGPHQ